MTYPTLHHLVYDTKNLSRYSFALLVAAVLVCTPGAEALAAGTDAIGAGLCKALGFITGNTGKAIATAAIIVIAIGALLGRISWGQVVMIAAGIAGLFGAAMIAGTIGGFDGACTTG